MSIKTSFENELEIINELKAGYPLFNNQTRKFDIPLPIQFPIRFSFSQKPTKIQYLKSFSTKKVNLFVKKDDDLSFILSGNKIRGAEYTFYNIYQQSLKKNVKEIHVITCGFLNSNHCRVAVFLAQQLGWIPHLLIMNENEKKEGFDPKEYDGNDFLVNLCGCDVKWVSLDEYDNKRDEMMMDIAKKIEEEEGKKAFVIPEGGSDEFSKWGYIEVVKEIEEQMKDSFPEHIFVPIGSGGTACALIIGCAFLKKKCKIWGVSSCYSSSVFENRIRSDLNKFNKLFKTDVKYPPKSSFEIIDNVVGKGYGVPYDEEIKIIKDLCKNEGIVVDTIYGGKTVVGLLTCLKNGLLDGNDEMKRGNVLYINSGGIFDMLSAEQRKYF